jgi:flavin reductase (DIM6/NTAB) family NADH-FMN oxidoreductase RutF
VLWCLQRSPARFRVFAGARYFGDGVPLLPGTPGQLVCRAARQADGGDHLIIIGAPVDGEVTGDRPPLVFFGGRYHAALAAAGTQCAAVPT